MDSTRKIQNSSLYGSFWWDRLPRHVRRVVSNIDSKFFYEAVAVDHHEMRMMRRNTMYVPLMGYVYEDGCIQARQVVHFQARQTGKTEAINAIYRLAVYKQGVWRAIAACPTAFSLDYLPTWWMYRGGWSGKSTELSLLDYVRGIYPATSPHLKDIIPHVMTGDSHRTVLRKRQVSPFHIAPPVMLVGPSNVGKSKPYEEMAQLLSSYALNITMGGKIR